ncbi:MAG: hypothetical protein DRO88_07535 [Promethearchaeia archaeon]|nr:MAG: hypothetical protein DRO88_07535 [Candidatus Lokiarchaeia archaeon]
MARTGKKTILIQVSVVDEIEDMIEYAQKRADNAGLKISVDYTHDIGLKLIVAGPRDKIQLYEHQIRDAQREMEQENDLQ